MQSLGLRAQERRNLPAPLRERKVTAPDIPPNDLMSCKS
jgi:hypothetical protein